MTFNATLGGDNSPTDKMNVKGDTQGNISKSKIWGLVVVNEQDNHDRQRLDSPLVYIGAHNVYYVKSYLSDTK